MAKIIEFYVPSRFRKKSGKVDTAGAMRESNPVRRA
jgi:hypothetical protein